MLEVKVFWTPGKPYLFSGLLGIHFKFSSFVLSNKSEWAIQGSFANCNISVDLDLFNGGIIEYI